jgi:hypothetical protein
VNHSYPAQTGGGPIRRRLQLGEAVQIPSPATSPATQHSQGGEPPQLPRTDMGGRHQRSPATQPSYQSRATFSIQPSSYARGGVTTHSLTHHNKALRRRLQLGEAVQIPSPATSPATQHRQGGEPPAQSSYPSQLPAQSHLLYTAQQLSYAAQLGEQLGEEVGDDL